MKIYTTAITGVFSNNEMIAQPSSTFSSGAIAGIVVGCLVGVGILIVVMVIFVKQNRRVYVFPSTQFTNSTMQQELVVVAPTQKTAILSKKGPMHESEYDLKVSCVRKKTIFHRSQRL